MTLWSCLLLLFECTDDDLQNSLYFDVFLFCRILWQIHPASWFQQPISIDHPGIQHLFHDHCFIISQAAHNTGPAASLSYPSFLNMKLSCVKIAFSVYPIKSDLLINYEQDVIVLVVRFQFVDQWFVWELIDLLCIAPCLWAVLFILTIGAWLFFLLFLFLF